MDACLWDAQTELLKRHLAGTGPVAFPPDGKLLAHGGTEFNDGANYVPTHLCDARTGRLPHVLRPIGLLASLAFSPDGKTLASGS